MRRSSEVSLEKLRHDSYAGSGRACQLRFSSSDIDHWLYARGDDGEAFPNYLSKEEIPKEIQAFAEIAKGGIAKAVPLKIVRKDGSLVHVEINTSPIISDGKITGVQAIVRDVSERYETEKMRNQFISAIS